MVFFGLSINHSFDSRCHQNAPNCFLFKNFPDPPRWRSASPSCFARPVHAPALLQKNILCLFSLHPNLMPVWHGYPVICSQRVNLIICWVGSALKTQHFLIKMFQIHHKYFIKFKIVLPFSAVNLSIIHTNPILSYEFRG